MQYMKEDVTTMRRKGSKQIKEDDTPTSLDTQTKSEGKSKDHDSGKDSDTDGTKPEKHRDKKKKKKAKATRWGCIDSCCWFIGYICVTWWFLAVLYHALPDSIPQYVTEKITGPPADPPGVQMKKDGLKMKHPVVFVPGIVTGGLELWEGKPCATGLFRKRLWGGTFGEIYKR